MKLGNSSHRYSISQRGSILVVCMVMCALGTLGVAAWLSLLDARSQQAEASLDALKRRVVYQNSKALAYRALYQNHLHADVALSADRTYTLPDSLGEATLRAYTPVPLNNAASTRTSKVGIAPIRSFTTDVTTALSDGAASTDWIFQLRSYHPVLGGDLLTINPITNPDDGDPIISGDVSVEGRAVFWDAVPKDFAGGLSADQIHIPNDVLGSISVATTDGDTQLPLNYPIPRQTSGITSGGPSYLGELDITQSGTNSHNDYAGRFVASGSSDAFDGTIGKTIGPGLPTAGDRANDDALEVEISSQNPATLITTLPSSYPLSSRILRAVADKNNPSFSADQLYEIFSNQIPVPNDAIAYLTSTHRAKIGPRSRELHLANGSAAYSDGNGKIEIFLDDASLPHLVITHVSSVSLIGQTNSTTAATAAALDPIGIAINNTGGEQINEITFEGRNARRLVLAMANETGTVPEMRFVGDIPFTRWHLIMDLQNTGGNVDLSSTAGATIVGGIRTNRKINVTGGQLKLEREYDYDSLEPLLSRNAWIEAYRQ